MNKRTFTQNDWNHLHDCVFDATGRDLNTGELNEIFNSLPETIKLIALEWGMSDTVFRDGVFDHLQNNASS